MEKIIYRLTLDTHKNGIQKTLQGFETADKIARRIAITLTSGSDTYEIADNVLAMMYVTTPNATVPSVNACSFEGNTIIYDVLPIEEEGTTHMQLKLIGVDEFGAESVLASPKFAVEVEESITSDDAVEQTTTFTALEEAIAKAEVVYNKRIESVEIDEDCVFRVHYADGTVYENTEIKEEVRRCVNARADIDIESVHESASQALISENNAKASENATKTSETNAKASEEKARVYADKALENAEGIAKSNDYTLPNSKAGGYRLNEMIGNTEQKTMSGKNLCDLTRAFNNSTYYDCTNEQCTILKEDLRGWSIVSSLLLEPNTEYTFSVQNKCILYIGFDGVYSKNEYTKNYITFTTSASGITHFKLLADSYPFNAGYVQIEKGSVATEYEPYCGGPSPNPSFPQAIENTFDCVEMIQGLYNTTTGAYQSAPTEVCVKRSVACKPNDVIKIDLEIARFVRICFYNGTTFVTHATSGSSSRVKTFSTSVPNGVDNFKFYIGESSNITPQTVGKITLTVNGKYVGQIVTDLGVEIIQGYYSTSNGKYVDSTTSVCSNDKIPCASGDTIKLKTENAIIHRVVFYKDNTFVTAKICNEYINEFSATVPNDVNQVAISLNNENGVTPDTVGKVSVSVNGVGEKVTTFFLNEPLRATDRVVKVDGVWYEEHNRTTCNLADFVDTTSVFGNNNRVRITLPINNGLGYTDSKNKTSLCSHFEYDSTAYIDGGTKVCFAIQTAHCWLRFGANSEITSLALAKEWITNEKPIVEYPLATPILTPLDTESQLALNDMVTFNGTTYIGVDSKIPPTSISGEYGTSKVGARTIKNELRNDTQDILIKEQNARIEDAINTMLLITP